jgi:hypothetical protein
MHRPHDLSSATIALHHPFGNYPCPLGKRGGDYPHQPINTHTTINTLRRVF